MGLDRRATASPDPQKATPEHEHKDDVNNMTVLEEQECVWNITAVRDETPSVKSFVLEMEDTKRPTFIAGQHLAVKLPGRDPTEGKAYSISSPPHEREVAITIKKIGTYSKALLSHHVGETLATSPPCGFFYPQKDNTGDIVFFAGGIGITPCMSIIEDLLHFHSPRTVHLHYSNQTAKDIVFKKRLQELKEKYPNFFLTFYITRETTLNPFHMQHRIQVLEVLSRLHRADDFEFFISGTKQFTRDMAKELKDGSVSPERIYTEGFF